MTLQEYLIHLTNGDIIHVWEDIDIPFEDSLICDYADSKGSDFFEFGDCDTCLYYVPKKNIVYISTGGTKEA